MRRPFISALATGLVAVLGWLGGASAEALTLVPPSLEFSVAPGQTIETNVKLYNESATPLTLVASTANFSAKDETGNPDFAFDVPSTDLAAWMVLGQTQITIAPSETATIPVTINVPANAEAGGHYAGVFFGSGGSDSSGGQVAIQSKIGTLVILRVSGNTRESGSIVEFSRQGQGTLTRLPTSFVLRLQNNGNVHFRPRGFVTVHNMFGGVTKTIPINPKEGAVLPGSIRLFDIDWTKDGAPSERGNFFQEIFSEARNFALGTYTADVLVTYGSENKTLVSSVKLTFFPWHFLLALLLAVTLLVWLLVWGIRRYNHMIIKRAQGGTFPPAAPRG